jgi:hypothetical protein
MKPEYAVLLGALIAPVIKALDVKEQDFGLTEKL